MTISNTRPLSRAEASTYLKEKHGISHSPAYLAKLTVTCGGPRFMKARRSVIYTAELLGACPCNRVLLDDEGRA